MLSAALAGLYPDKKQALDDGPPCLENPRPEGAESTLAENVASMCIELHGPACERAFRLATAPYRFEELQCGEYTVCLDVKRFCAM
jgi:hypothetical protein